MGKGSHKGRASSKKTPHALRSVKIAYVDKQRTRPDLELKAPGPKGQQKKKKKTPHPLKHKRARQVGVCFSQKQLQEQTGRTGQIERARAKK